MADAMKSLLCSESRKNLQKMISIRIFVRILYSVLSQKTEKIKRKNKNRTLCVISVRNTIS